MTESDATKQGEHTIEQGGCYKRVLRLFVSLVISAATAVIRHISR